MKQLTLLLLTITTLGFGQNNVLSLDSCLQMAKRNYPLIKQNALIIENADNTVNADNKAWLPKLAFSGNATYQSEVISFQGITFPHDAYAASVGLEQNIFDGGQTHQQKKLDKLNGENSLQLNQVELYKLIDRITQLYSGILLNRENLHTLQIYKNDVDNKKTIVTASFNNGMLLQSDVDVLEAEELKTEQ
ncbi:MAG TPA: TolC family protein, partial [Bacteroidia bacterium]|nr:TolC family protein [Bacteroidia bacterium]